MACPSPKQTHLAIEPVPPSIARNEAAIERHTAPGRDELREALLLATLPHVAFDGWGQKALMAGARDASIAPPLALNAFPAAPPR